MQLLLLPFSGFKKSDKEADKAMNAAFTIVATEGGVGWSPSENPFDGNDGILLDKKRHSIISPADRSLMSFHAARSLIKYSKNSIKLDTIKFDKDKEGKNVITIATESGQIEV